MQQISLTELELAPTIGVQLAGMQQAREAQATQSSSFQ